MELLSYFMFRKIQVLSNHSMACQVTSYICGWNREPNGSCCEFLAISLSSVDWFVCKMEVILWSIRTSQPGAWSRHRGLGFASRSYSFDGLLAVCFSFPGVSVSAYARQNYLSVPIVTPTHKWRCLMYHRKRCFFFLDCGAFNLLLPDFQFIK